MADEKKSLHTICAWTFNPGKGGFVPSDMRPEWADISTVDKIGLIRDQIAPRMPDNVKLGMEMHYDGEVNDVPCDPNNAASVADALIDAGIHLGMTTPGAHARWGYGGIASMDPDERAAANDFGKATVDLTYGPLRAAWHPEVVPTLVLWNGSWGYDLQSPAIAEMLNHADEGVAGLVEHEQGKGGLLYKAIEPKQNEGHPAMLIGTVGETIAMWKRLVDKYGIKDDKLGVNKEFGHSQMVGLDMISETAQEIAHKYLVHMHLNSQGGEAGLLGGSGKYDIDNGAQITEANVSMAYLIQQAGFDRWKGHDMQPRAGDNVEQALDRVVRSVLSWEACEHAARQLDYSTLVGHLVNRDTAKAQDMMGDAVQVARTRFKEMYQA